MFRQDPGKINAMSSTKINFPSPEAVYMHDTPNPGPVQQADAFRILRLCTRSERARPHRLGAEEHPGWNRQEIERVIASRVNTPIKVTDEVGVH